MQYKSRLCYINLDFGMRYKSRFWYSIYIGINLGFGMRDKSRFWLFYINLDFGMRHINLGFGIQYKYFLV